jgi:hypothetical protein
MASPVDRPALPPMVVAVQSPSWSPAINVVAVDVGAVSAAASRVVAMNSVGPLDLPASVDRKRYGPKQTISHVVFRCVGRLFRSTELTRVRLVLWLSLLELLVLLWLLPGWERFVVFELPASCLSILQPWVPSRLELSGKRKMVTVRVINVAFISSCRRRIACRFGAIRMACVDVAANGCVG